MKAYEQNWKRITLTVKRSVLELLASCLIYSLVIICIDVTLIFIFLRDLSQVLSFLTLIVLVEGGLGLVVGGSIGLNSPIISKVSETIFRSKPLKAKDRKELEKQAKSWILTGFILVVEALLVSAI